MARELDDQEIEEYKEFFYFYAKDGNVETPILGELLSNMEKEISETKIKHLLQEIDAAGHDSIDFPTFLRLIIAREMEELRETFQVFDKDGTGFVTRERLAEILKILGQNLTLDEVQEMIDQSDKDGDGKLNFEDFVSVMNAK